MRIPFTNIQIGIVPKQKKGLAFGRFWSKDTSRDFTGMRLSVDTLFNAYRVQGDIYACVRELCEGIGRKGYEIIDKNTGEELNNKATEEIDFILNSLQPWRQLKYDTIRDKYVTGNGFWYLVRNTQNTKIVGLQRLDPRTIAIVATQEGEIVRYIQTINGRNIVFAPEEIIYFKYGSDPQHEIFGFSPLESVLWDVRTDVSASISNYAFFQNDAQPAAYYILDPDLSESEEDAAFKMIEKQFKGADKRHKSGILSGVKEIKTVSISQKDMEFLAGRAFVTDKICAAFGVPKFMLGYTENVNYQNSVSIMQVFAENTITPAEEYFAETITRNLLPRLGYDNLALKFNPQNLEEESSLEARALLELQMGVLTPKQYKVKTRQDLEPEDEQNPMFDKHIIYQGINAKLLENIDIDPFGDNYGQQTT